MRIIIIIIITITITINKLHQIGFLKRPWRKRRPTCSASLRFTVSRSTVSNDTICGTALQEIVRLARQTKFEIHIEENKTQSEKEKKNATRSRKQDIRIHAFQMLYLKASIGKQLGCKLYKRKL